MIIRPCGLVVEASDWRDWRGWTRLWDRWGGVGCFEGANDYSPLWFDGRVSGRASRRRFL